MSERQETHATVMTEMRDFADKWEKQNFYDCRHLGTDALRAWADRAEAAAKREATAKKSLGVGNAAAMREALSDACYAMFNFLKTQNGGYEEMANALDKAKAALAAPPRNCDVGTAEEQAARMRAFCAKNGLCRDGAYRCENCGFLHEFRCELKWAQMPYVDGGADYQEKGKADGSK